MSLLSVQAIYVPHEDRPKNSRRWHLPVLPCCQDIAQTLPANAILVASWAPVCKVIHWGPDPLLFIPCNWSSTYSAHTSSSSKMLHLEGSSLTPVKHWTLHAESSGGGVCWGPDVISNCRLSPVTGCCCTRSSDSKMQAFRDSLVKSVTVPANPGQLASMM